MAIKIVCKKAMEEMCHLIEKGKFKNISDENLELSVRYKI